MHFDQDDIIHAISSPPGMGAIALIRISGKNGAIALVDRLFDRDVLSLEANKSIYARLKFEGELIDDVVLTIYRGPHSFTGEDTLEIACHGSVYIQQQIMMALQSSGSRLAKPGEFTMRGFTNGKMDLVQAEAIADLIESESAAQHQMALSQMRGGFSSEISDLRQKLIDFASLIELELDFSEEDVEFADRSQLENLLDELNAKLNSLVNSFASGNAIKKGVPVAIVGKPNAGKSTLLNRLLGDDRAIVSDVAGTTRDTIEDTTILDGIQFRFIDTAGLRDTEDVIEAEGVERSMEKVRQASCVLYMYDASDSSESELKVEVSKIRSELHDNAQLIVVANKADLLEGQEEEKSFENTLRVSASKGQGVDELKQMLVTHFGGDHASGSVVVSNQRHYESLKLTLESIQAVIHGLASGISGDFLAIDIRRALHHLGEITGEITSDDLLGNIFGRFCIGK